jgi:hypothetical protein
VASIREWLKERPEPKNEAYARLVYLTQRGLSWHKEAFDSPLSNEFGKLLRKLDINGGRGFYVLRHTYCSEAGRCADTEALYYTMATACPAWRPSTWSTSTPTACSAWRRRCMRGCGRRRKRSSHA